MIINIENTLIQSAAKINLCLQVTGKLPNNYHMLNSLAVFGVVYDNICISKNNVDKVIFFGQQVPQENTVTKTLKYIDNLGFKRPNLLIEITKNIPSGAGLGGASSNAAAILKLVSKLTNFEFNLKEIAKIGADVPVSYVGKSQIFTGIGEQITEIKLPKLYILLVKPDIHSSTADMFAKIENYSKSKEFNNDYDNIINLCEDLAEAGNDFAKFYKHNIISEIKDSNGCYYASLTGTGSTCFGIFNNFDTLESSYLHFKKRYPYYWIERGSI